MRSKAIYAILMIVVLFSQSVIAHAHEAQSNGERIRLLREEIKKRETAEVPDDLKEMNRSKLMERRAELRTLLRVEIGNLQKYKTQLGTLITPEEDQKIALSVQGYDAEIKSLADAMQRDLAAESQGQSSSSASGEAAAFNPQPAVQPNSSGSQPDAQPATATPAQPVTNAGEANTGTTNAGSNSAGQPVSAAQPQDPDAFAPANASEEIEATDDPVNCSEVNAPGGQTKAFSQLDITICGLVQDNLERRRLVNRPVKILNLNSTDFFNLVVIMIAKRETPAFLVEAEEKRLDKQVGSAPANAGSTSLVVKGGAPAILGFAVENGALTQSVNGTGVTFRGNPVGIFNALANNGFIPSLKEDQKDPLLRFLKKTSFAFTFNTDRGPDLGVLTATKQQLASFSARVEFINNRRPELYIKEWEDFLVNQAQPFANSLNASTSQLTVNIGPEKGWRDPALQAWFAETNQALTAAGDDEVEAVLKDRLEKLPVTELSQSTVLQLNGIEKELGVYLNGRETVLNKINSGTVVTFEYLNNREVNAPDTSNFRFIAEKGTAGGGIDLTFNGSLTIFNKKPVPTADLLLSDPSIIKIGSVRDFQFAGQLDKPFDTGMGQFVLWLSGRYERLMEDASTQVGTIIPNTKGDIAVAQFGLRIPIKGLGMKFPISITFANRTELIKEKEVRGNFGFTLDLDTLFAKFKPF